MVSWHPYIMMEQDRNGQRSVVWHCDSMAEAEAMARRLFSNSWDVVRCVVYEKHALGFRLGRRTWWPDGTWAFGEHWQAPLPAPPLLRRGMLA